MKVEGSDAPHGRDNERKQMLRGDKGSFWCPSLCVRFALSRWSFVVVVAVSPVGRLRASRISILVCGGQMLGWRKRKVAVLVRGPWRARGVFLRRFL